MKNNFYITAPIYYVNGVPHIGHFYSTLIADTIHRYKKISGYNTRFTTGVDENSQKALQAAEEKGMEIMPYLDDMASQHKAVWDNMNIDYTDFIRTTESRHHEVVQEVLQKTFDNGDIYEGEYEGMYCVGCEAFKKDDDLIQKDGEKICPDHLKIPDKIKEKNYFFRLSKYEDKLLEFYENNPDFVTPADRFNEVKAFVKRGLEDFSISRETNTFGIQLPFDKEQVTYVWFDALYNYISSLQKSPSGNDERDDFWPASLHVVGKDIIRFHAIYWPAMLMSVGYELPKQILTGGFFTVNGQKMSKSLGNVIDPVAFSNEFCKEMLSLYLLSGFNIGQDGDFDEKQALLTYNAKLANNLGNLVNRVVVLGLKVGGLLNAKIDENIANNIEEYIQSFTTLMDEYNLKQSLDTTFAFLDTVNKYVDKNEPWKLIKNEETIDEAKQVLTTVAECVRVAGISLYSFFPEKMEELFTKIGLQNYSENLLSGKKDDFLYNTEEFHLTEKGKPLFQRFEVEK